MTAGATVSTSKRLPKTINGYKIEALLGEGGMGEVLLGEHPVLERKVAIKRLLPDMAGSEEMSERFMREGRALARLQHQGVCTVFDLFQKQGNHFMVLEYVDGYDVATLLKKGPLPADVAAIIGMRVADALDHAHHHGILHRDIKPANVMVSKSGDVKLMDFGIALTGDLDRVTRTGMMVGTPSYMAPEVIRGDPADARSDIYAVGCMLYQCIAGQKMFAHAGRENLYALIEQGRYPPLKRVAPFAPRMLRRIVERCLQLRPERRYQNAADLRQALEVFLSTHHGWASHTDRMVTFLFADGHLSEDEALTCVDADHLVKSRSIELREARSVPMSVAVIGLAAAAFLMGTLVYGASNGWLDGFSARFKERSEKALEHREAAASSDQAP